MVYTRHRRRRARRNKALACGVADTLLAAVRDATEEDDHVDGCLLANGTAALKELAGSSSGCAAVRAGVGSREALEHILESRHGPGGWAGGELKWVTTLLNSMV